MTVKELYESIGGDYAEIIGRLGSDMIVQRIVVKLLSDTSCRDLQDAWAAGDEEAAFKAAHTAKGVYGNLSLTAHAQVASKITEALRPGNDDLRATTDVDALIAQLVAKNDDAMAQVAAFAAR